jgi:hypothetical protein
MLIRRMEQRRRARPASGAGARRIWKDPAPCPAVQNSRRTVIAVTESEATDWHGEGKKTAPRRLRNPNTRNAAMTASPAFFAAIQALTTTRVPAGLFLDRIFGGFGTKRNRDKLALTYQNLLCADDHMLRDIGMTRLDVLRLREDLFRK